MPIQRLGILNPPANDVTPLVTFSAAHLISVIVANKATTATPLTKVSIWVIPSGATIDAQYSYLAFNLAVPLGSSFETFRFAVNPGDVISVRSTVSTTSFTCIGIPQDDAAQPSALSQVFTNKVIRGTSNTIYVDSGQTADRRPDAEEGYVRYNSELNSGGGALELLTSVGWEAVGVGQASEGPIGPTGPTGPSDGPQGPIGLQGPIGPTGAQAIAINLLGSVADFASLPSSGQTFSDSYLADDDANVYFWDNAAWVSLGPIVGPTGPEGQTGLTGTQGISGVDGANGAQGDIGPVGPVITLLGTVADVASLPDTAGLSGNVAYYVEAEGALYLLSEDVVPPEFINVGAIFGPTGPASTVPGPLGPTGPQGIIGPTGAASTVEGPTGPQGLVGPLGPTGVEGPQGTSVTVVGSVATIGDLPVSATVNDAYVVNATGELYVWDGAAWNNIGLVQGPTGPTGSVGATGDAGQVAVGDTTDVSTFVALYENATGDQEGKTNTGIVYNASEEKLTVTNMQASSLVSTTELLLSAPQGITALTPFKLANYTKAQLFALSYADPGSMAFCTDEVGGAVPVFYDGSDWRRVTDREVVL
jgi:hypothetical protein